MQAYLNDPQLKKDFLEQIRLHQEADQIVQGSYGEKDAAKFRGCAIGCSINSLNIIKGKNIDTDDHKACASELGWPEWLVRLEDTIFEGLPVAEAQQWPLRFAQAIPVGADVERVRHGFCAYLMIGNIERVLALDIENGLKEQAVSAIRGVLILHENAFSTGEWPAALSALSADSAARSAASAAASAADSAALAADLATRSAAALATRSAAYSAAALATRSAAYSAADLADSATRSARSAYSAARSAAYSAAYSARSAALVAYSATRSAAALAAYAKEYQQQANKLIELLQECKEEG